MMPEKNSSNNSTNEYRVVCELPPIVLADSFVKNKIGSGNGEAKLYIGQEGNELICECFDQFLHPMYCFIQKSNIVSYLDSAKDEFFNPTQSYREPEKLQPNYYSALKIISEYNSEIIRFSVEKSNAITPPRIYIKSTQSKDFFNLLRAISFTNYTTLNIAKVIGKGSRCLLQFSIYYNNPNRYDSTYDNIASDIKENVIVSDDVNISGNNQKELNDVVYNRIVTRLHEQYRQCLFSGIDLPDLLIPTIIKPKQFCKGGEVDDFDNYLLLSPLFSFLMTNGLISVDKDLCLDISSKISSTNRKRMKLTQGEYLSDFYELSAKTKDYLFFHYENVFRR